MGAFHEPSHKARASTENKRSHVIPANGEESADHRSTLISDLRYGIYAYVSKNTE